MYVVLALVVMARVAAADPGPVELLWDTDFGPSLLDPSVAVVVVRVDGVTAGAGNRPSRLRTMIERAFRGPHKVGEALELPFIKQAHYKKPIDKARAFHDQWQELPLAKGDLLVFLLADREPGPAGSAAEGRRGSVDGKDTPLSVLPTTLASDDVNDLARCLASGSFAAIVTDAMQIDRRIPEAFARAALGAPTALTRDDKASAIAATLASRAVANERKQTWSLYFQGVFDHAQGGDAANVAVVKSLVAATLAAGARDRYFFDLLTQFLVQDYGDGNVKGRAAIVKALDPAQVKQAIEAFTKRAAAATDADDAKAYRALANVLGKP